MAGKANGHKKLKFILDGNLGLEVDKEPWASFLAHEGVECLASSDLPMIGSKMSAHDADVAYIPASDYHRLTGKGDWFYKGLVIAVSKYTGQPSMDAVLVVAEDDPAQSIDDLAGSRYGYINKSCSSSYFPPAIILNGMGRTLDFLDIMPVKPWQGQIDAVLAGEIRATMVPGDVWHTTASNAERTRIIGRLTDTKPPVVVVRDGLDGDFLQRFSKLLTNWLPEWNAVYGGFKPYYLADMQRWFHELGELPRGL